MQTALFVSWKLLIAITVEIHSAHYRFLVLKYAPNAIRPSATMTVESGNRICLMMIRFRKKHSAISLFIHSPVQSLPVYNRCGKIVDWQKQQPFNFVSWSLSNVIIVVLWGKWCLFTVTINARDAELTSIHVVAASSVKRRKRPLLILMSRVIEFSIQAQCEWLFDFLKPLWRELFEMLICKPKRQHFTRQFNMLGNVISIN